MLSKEIVLLKTLDFIKRTRVAANYSVLKKSLNMDRQEVINWQFRKLKRLLMHAQQTVPYYKQVFQQFNFNAHDFTDTNELKNLPLLTRDHIHHHNDQLLSSVFSKKYLIKGSSSGTTGIPITYYMDSDGMSAGVAAGYLLLGMSGWIFGQQSLHIWGNQSSIERWDTLTSRIKNRIIRQKNIASTLLDDPLEIGEIANSIIKFQPLSIDGYTSSIYTLAKYFKEKNLSLNSVRQVLTTAENLQYYQKQLIEEVFAPTGDLYGSGEVLGIATRPAGEDRYYIIDTHVIVETEESGVPGMKNIILTDLDNYGMPMIRYKIGDMIDDVYAPDHNSLYPLSWFKMIQGRSSDIITLPNGMKFHPINIFGGTLFRKFQGITRHKVIWNGSKLIFVFEAQHFSENENLHDALKEMLEKYRVDFEVQFTSKIFPSASGKYRFMEINDDSVVRK
jgi:phenylacetate-CoA ligase